MRIRSFASIYEVTFMPRLFPVNCFLVKEEDGLTLIDAAMPISVKGILQAAASLNAPIRRIVLTHAHSDHVGALDGLKRALPDAQVYISARDARLLAGDVSLEPHELQAPIRGGIPKHIATRPDVLLRDGDPVGSLLSVSAPGHTPGSMAFFDARSRALIAGDAFQLRGGVAVSGTMRPWFPFPALATWSKLDALCSAKKLRALQPALLAVGHGTMLESPLPTMDRAIAEAERALGALPQERSV